MNSPANGNDGVDAQTSLQAHVQVSSPDTLKLRTSAFEYTRTLSLSLSRATSRQRHTRVSSSSLILHGLCNLLGSSLILHGLCNFLHNSTHTAHNSITCSQMYQESTNIIQLTVPNESAVTTFQKPKAHASCGTFVMHTWHKRTWDVATVKKLVLICIAKLPFTTRNLTFEQAARLASVAEQGAVAGALLADELVGGGAAGAAGRGRVVGQLAELVLWRVVLVLVVRKVLHECRARACKAHTLTHTTSRYSIAFTA